MTSKLYYILTAALLFSAGCSKDQGDSKPTEADFGQLRISCTPNTDITVRAAANAPAGDAFAVIITDGQNPLHWNTLAEFNAASPLFRYGNYTASVAWGDPKTEGINAPYYSGQKEFTVLPRQVTEIGIAAKMVKAQVLIRTTERFRSYFKDAHFTLATGTGNTFDYYFASTALPAVPDTNDNIFVLAQTSLSITGTAYKQAPTTGGERPRVTFPEQKIDAAKATTRHIFEFDAANAGSATLRILLDDTLIETVAIEVELNDGALPE